MKLKDLLKENWEVKKSVNSINEWKLELDLGKVNPLEFEKWADSSLQKKHKIKVSGSNKNWTIVGKGNDDRMGSSADWISQLLGKAWTTNKIKVVKKESVNESWEVKDGKVLSNGKLIGYYDFDRDSDSFWVDDVKKGKGQLSFDTKREVEDYFKKNERDAVKYLQKLRESLSEATMHPMTREGALDNLREVILNIKPYSREVVKHCEAAIKIIEKFDAK